MWQYDWQNNILHLVNIYDTIREAILTCAQKL